jgi:hypothetical protein
MRGKCATIAGVLLVVMLLICMGCEDEPPAPSPAQEQTQEAQESLPEPEVDQNLPYEEWLKQTISNAIGTNSNMDKPRVDSILFLDDVGSDMEIILWADTSFTHSMVRDGIILHSTDVLRRVFSDPRAERVSLYWLLPAKDSYGDETETMAARVVLPRLIKLTTILRPGKEDSAKTVPRGRPINTLINVAVPDTWRVR